MAKKEEKAVEVDISYIPRAERPKDKEGNPIEMGKRGNSWQDMINEIKANNLESAGNETK